MQAEQHLPATRSSPQVYNNLSQFSLRAGNTAKKSPAGLSS